MNHVTPQEWNSILKKASGSLDLLPKNLSLPQTVNISLAKLKEIREKYLKNEIEESDYIHLTHDIADDTIELITTQEKKKNYSLKQFILAALFSLILIGIPFLLKLLREEKQHKTEIHHLKRLILQSNEANSHALLLKKLDNLPFILEDIKKRYTDHRRQELINAQMLADWLDDENTPISSREFYDPEFESDIRAGASFQRIDKVWKIEDKVRLPLLHLEANQRVRAGAALLKELIKKPEDLRWEMVLQLAITHASLITAFKAVLSAFNIDAAKIQWESNGKYYSIKSIFSDELPPVILEIIRHPQNGTIEKVIVAIKGSIDIVSYNTFGHEAPKMIIPNAMTEDLKYSITFGEDNRPTISDLHSQIKSNVYIPKQ